MRFEKLGNILSIQKGKKPKFSESPTENSVRVLQIDDLRNDNKIQYTDEKTGVLANEEDILIAWDGANAGTIGYGKSGYIGSTIAVLRKKRPNDFSTTFLGKFLQSQSNFLKGKSTGATIPHIDRQSLENLVVPIIPLEDQIRIATLLSKAEAIIKQRKESIDLLDVYLKSTFLEMFGDPVRNEKKFPIARIDDISTEIKDGPHVSPNYVSEGVPILSTRNIRPGELVLDDVKYVSQEVYFDLTKRFKPQKNDILVTKGGTTGYAKVVDFDFDFCVWVHIAVIRPKPSVLPLYIEHFINSDFGYIQTQRYTRGIANRDLGLKRIATIELLLPPLELQKHFSDIAEKVKELKKQYKSSLAELENLYGSLSQKAFKGELNLEKGEELLMAAEPVVGYGKIIVR